MVISETARDVAPKPIHNHPRQSLSLSHGTIFVCQEQSLETNDFFPQLGYLARKGIIFSRE